MTRYRWIATLVLGLLVACSGAESGDPGDSSSSATADANSSAAEPNAEPTGTFEAKWGMGISAEGLTGSTEGDFVTCCLVGFQGSVQSPVEDNDTGVWIIGGGPDGRENIEATTYSPTFGANFYFPGVAQCVQLPTQEVTLTVTDAGPPARGEFEATVRCVDTEDDDVVLAEEASVTGWFELFR